MGNSASSDCNEFEIVGTCITYTQVVRHVEPNKKLQGNLHGGNRDSVVVKVLSPHFAVCCVADGAGLMYWSEVTSRVASEKFVDFFENFVGETKDPSVSLVQNKMKEAVLYVNKELIEYKHPKTNERLSLFDEKGGQTTLGGFVLWKLNDKDRKEYRSRFGACCIGTGDSPSFKFDCITTKWVQMFSDHGQMLPFYGLDVHNIKDSTFTTISVGDALLACSDGVTDSFVDRTLPPVKSSEDLATNMAKKNFGKSYIKFY